MDIQISVQNPQKAIALLEFLKSFEMIDTFKLVENFFSQKPLAKNEVSFFDKFHGKTKSGHTLEQIDNQLRIKVYKSIQYIIFHYLDEFLYYSKFQ